MSAELRYELEKAAVDCATVYNAHEVAVRLEGILGGHVDEATQRFVYEEKQVETKEL
jgi:hypothetical protein